MIMDTQEFICANDLVEKYENNFPTGKYIEEAKELNYIYFLTTELQNNDNYTSSALSQTYLNKYSDGKHNDIVATLGEIRDKNS